MYQTLTTNELLTQIEEEEIIRLSNYKAGEEYVCSFENYIYNDTDNDITIITKMNVGDEEYTKTYIIKANKVYRFSWVYIDSITVK